MMESYDTKQGDPSLRKMTADGLLRHAVDEDGGPLIHNGSQAEQRSFDSTCRKLHRFLAQGGELHDEGNP